MPSDGIYRQRFGSWGNALTEAGLSIKKPVISAQCRIAMIEAHRGQRSFAWKGGRIIDNNGYIHIWKPSHPNANIGRAKAYVAEHRMVMSDFLRRPLMRTEQVHHKNGDRSDNRLENLELWSTSQPNGQRVEDKLKWAHEFINIYENPELLK